MDIDHDIPGRPWLPRFLLVWGVPIAIVLVLFSVTGNDSEHVLARQHAAAMSQLVARAEQDGLGALSPLIAPLAPGAARSLATNGPASATAGTDGVPAAGASAPATVRLSTRATGAPIAPGFIGFSLEFPAVVDYAGSGRNRPFERLLDSVSGDRPILRIGGVSTDNSWWPVPGVRKPAGINYVLGARFAAALRSLVLHTGAHVILGVNLKLNRPRWAAYAVNQILRQVPRRAIDALEIGNEPTYFGTLPWFSAHGHRVYARPHKYLYTVWRREFAAEAARLPGFRLAAPSVGGFKWLSESIADLRTSPRVTLVTQHRYPLDRCSGPGSPQFATLPRLLSDFSVNGFLRQVRPFVTATHRAHRRFVIDEVNSVSCGGKRGLSDRFAAALWAPPALSAMVALGVDAVNIHTFASAIYAPFSFTAENGGYTARVNPLFYGLQLFHLAAPPGFRELPLRPAAPATLRTAATRSAGGEIRVLLVNDALSRSQDVSVAGAHGNALLLRMTAPSVTSADGITLGGVSYRSDGTLQGARRLAAVRPSHGRYTVRLGPASAALLIIPAR